MKLDKSELINAQNIAKSLEKARWREISGLECIALAEAIQWYLESVAKCLKAPEGLRVLEPKTKLSSEPQSKSQSKNHNRSRSATSIKKPK